MKNIKLLMMFMLLGNIKIMHATFTLAIPVSIPVYNKSNLWLRAGGYVVVADGSSVPHWTDILAPGAKGVVNFNAGDVVDGMNIYYSKSSTVEPVSENTSAAIDGRMFFGLNAMDNNCSLYIYGNSAITPGQTDTTVAATPVPARYAAWWTKPVDVTTLTTVDAAKADAGVKASVTMHMANVNGTDERTLPAGDPAAAY